jgi:hypothetical protein
MKKRSYGPSSVSLEKEHLIENVKGPRLFTARHFNINAVRDSSPLKTIASFQSTGLGRVSYLQNTLTTSFNNHSGPLSDRGMFRARPKTKEKLISESAIESFQPIN